MTSCRAWLTDCIHRVQSLRVVYDRSETFVLSERDVSTVKASLVLRSGLVFDLFGTAGRSLDAWFAFLSGEQFKLLEFEDTLKDVKELFFDDSLSGQLEPSCFKGKILSLKGTVPCWAAIAPLAYCEFSNAAECAAKLNQWCSFSSRLSLLDTPFGRECLDEYIEDEKFFSSIVYPKQIIRMMEQVVFEWFHDFYPDWSLCSHGSGACAELPRGTPAWCKNLFLGVNPKIRYLLRQYPELTDIYPVQDEYLVPDYNIVQNVPKNIRKNRIVSKEPAAYQYLQHGIERSLKLFMENDERLDAYYHSKDQCVNRRAALQGSLGGRIATIDLSKASDTNTAKLVLSVTRRCFHLRRCLLLTRSSWARVDYSKAEQVFVHLSKFAPMGSDTCFDVEKIIFGSAIEATYRNVVGKPSRPGTWSVYGDDIVVPSFLAPYVLETLELLGMQPNRSKSYIREGSEVFRESCGAECFAGHDITPVRISRFFSYTRQKRSTAYPTCVAQCVDLCNSLELHGLHNTRTAQLILLRGILLPMGGLSKLAFVQTPVWEESTENLSYYFLDGYRRYEHLYPIPHWIERAEIRRMPLSLFGNATNYGTTKTKWIRRGHVGAYAYCNHHVRVLNQIRLTLQEKNSLVRAVESMDERRLERAMLDQWFCNARLRDRGIQQQLAIRSSIDSYHAPEMFSKDYRDTSVQRHGFLAVLRVCDTAIPSDTDTLRVWLARA